MNPGADASHKHIPKKGPTFPLGDGPAGLPLAVLFSVCRNRTQIEATFTGPLKMT